MKKNIVIFGYPKSGNTWLTRLVAQLLECPVKGYYGADEKHQDIAIEGVDRVSDYLVWKGHQTYNLASPDFVHITPIYVVRDVRDVSISGANYYGFPATPVEKSLKRLPMLWRFGNYLRHNEARNIDRMIRILGRGTKSIAHLGTPWDQHVGGYFDSGVLMVRYEDLLADAIKESRRISDYLNISLSEDYIEKAVEKQSFSQVKEKFSKSGDMKREKFLRSGQAEQWRKKLSSNQRRCLENRFSVTLRKLNYPL